MALRNKPVLHEKRILLSDYLSAPDGGKKNKKHSPEVKAHIATVRKAIQDAKINTGNIYVTDLPGRAVAQMHQQAIYLDRKTLKSSTAAEIEHRLRHEEVHREGVFSEGLVELHIAPHNKTGRKFYEDEQGAVRVVTDILSPSNGVKQAMNLYRQRKIKLLYRTFLLNASKKKIKPPEAKNMFRRAFPELMEHL